MTEQTNNSPIDSDFIRLILLNLFETATMKNLVVLKELDNIDYNLVIGRYANIEYLEDLRRDYYEVFITKTRIV